jgi:hypothetical protein
LSLETVKEYVKDHDKEMAYGGDIDVVKYINGKRHTINPPCPVEIDLLNDFFHTQKCSLRLLKPHELSDSLAKLMCLGDELF